MSEQISNIPIQNGEKEKNELYFLGEKVFSKLNEFVKSEMGSIVDKERRDNFHLDPRNIEGILAELGLKPEDFVIKVENKTKDKLNLSDEKVRGFELEITKDGKSVLETSCFY